MRSRLTAASFLRIATIAFGTFAIAAAPPPSTAPPPEAEKPHIELDAPWTVQPNSQFDLAVAYVAGEEDEPAEVTMATTNGVAYSKRSMTLKPGETGHVTVTVSKTASGLAQLMLMTNLEENARLTIDAGFSGNLEWRNPRPVNSYGTESITLSFLDNHHRLIPLDAPITLHVIAPAHTSVRAGPSKTFSSFVDLNVPTGATETEPIDVQPTGFAASSEELHVTAKINPEDDDPQVLFNEAIPFQVVPPIWMRIGVTLAGAILCGLWQYSRRAEHLFTWGLVTSMFASLIAAVVAFALADLNVLGIRIDTTQLTGYFVIGVIASYVGLDQMLERVVKKAAEEKKRTAAEKDPEPGPATI
ncbi:MAG TPA: hypothetical protein VHY33_01175 [Thermoanaerobaculia bacterium]|jgi:hypothetical protein|nr:hypothetical protein [Thermoanaerobaculia bacterium]